MSGIAVPTFNNDTPTHLKKDSIMLSSFHLCLRKLRHFKPTSSTNLYSDFWSSLVFTKNSNTKYKFKKIDIVNLTHFSLSSESIKYKYK